MVKVVYRVVAKDAKEDEFKNIAKICTESARKTKGCISYTFFQSIDNSCEFLVYYKFETIEDQNVHIENLRKLLGPSPEGRDLPAMFLNLLSDEELVLFERS